MSERLAGKTAVVTAAGQGIGRATAIAFAQEGATVWATDINRETLNALARDYPQMVCRELDVRSPKEIELLAEQLPQPDILFNCAGFVHHGTILDCKEEDWEVLLSTSTSVRCTAPAAPFFLACYARAGAVSLICLPLRQA